MGTGMAPDITTIDTPSKRDLGNSKHSVLHAVSHDGDRHSVAVAPYELPKNLTERLAPTRIGDFLVRHKDGLVGIAAIAAGASVIVGGAIAASVALAASVAPAFAPLFAILAFGGGASAGGAVNDIIGEIRTAQNRLTAAAPACDPDDPDAKFKAAAAAELAELLGQPAPGTKILSDDDLLIELAKIGAITDEDKARLEEEALSENAKRKALKNLQAGQYIEGKGVYVGTHEVTGKGGLKKIFDLYAAPEDLTDKNDQKLVATYNDAVKALRQKKDWHGHDGECFENHKKLKEALADGTYQGGWFIGTREMVKALYRHKDKGALKDTFTDKRGSDLAHWCWSCTEHPVDSSGVCNVDFTDGGGGWYSKDYFELSVRPVRAELRPS